MQFNQLSSQCQAETRAFMFLGIDRSQLGECVEELREIILPDTHTGVRQGDCNEVAVSHCNHLHSATGRGELDRI